MATVWIRHRDGFSGLVDLFDSDFIEIREAFVDFAWLGVGLMSVIPIVVPEFSESWYEKRLVVEIAEDDYLCDRAYVFQMLDVVSDVFG